jgi:hypothetical protein
MVQKVDKSSLGLGTQGHALGKAADQDKAWREMLHELAVGDGYSQLLAYVGAFFDSGYLNLMECLRRTAPPLGTAPANTPTSPVLVP